MKNIPVSKTTWQKLRTIKRNRGFRGLSQAVEYLVDGEENVTLLDGKLKEEFKPKNITPVAPKATLLGVYDVADDLEKEQRGLEKLRDEIRDEKAHTENVCATEELRCAITDEIHAQDAYEDAKREMRIAEEDMIRVRSEMDEIKQLFDHFEVGRIDLSAPPHTQP